MKNPSSKRPGVLGGRGDRLLNSTQRVFTFRLRIYPSNHLVSKYRKPSTSAMSKTFRKLFLKGWTMISVNCYVLRNMSNKNTMKKRKL